jgi:hypothetical protein
MNSLANQYQQILSTLTHCPESEGLEPLLANFASQVAIEGQTLVYCQQAKEQFLPLGPSVSLLNLYGIDLTGNWHQGRRYIYATLKPTDPTPYPTSQVLEHVQDWQVAA